MNKIKLKGEVIPDSGVKLSGGEAFFNVTVLTDFLLGPVKDTQAIEDIIKRLRQASTPNEHFTAIEIDIIHMSLHAASRATDQLLTAFCSNTHHTNPINPTLN
jgi:hypothetical protein